MSELRWNPVLREWVVTATHRQNRTFFPPAEYCPLCPTAPGGFPTEIPFPDYEIAVFENKFPSFQATPPAPDVDGTGIYPVAPASGCCEVVCYTPDHNSELAHLGEKKIEQLIYVWADRFAALGEREDVRSILIFENKGKEIGVTLSHPHGQIYAYPYINPILERELAGCKEHFITNGECLLCRIAADELLDGRRIVAVNDDFVAVIPFFARYPYELHILPRRHRPAITDLTGEERTSLASMLDIVLRKYNNLWDRSLPYIMVLHQRPTDGDDYPHYDFHIEFYPPYRSPDKLKYLAGSEAGAGVYINDTIAEEKAAELRAISPVTGLPR